MSKVHSDQIVSPLVVDTLIVGSLVINSICITRLVSSDLTVQSGLTCLQRDPEIADGVTVSVNDTGELLVL